MARRRLRLIAADHPLRFERGWQRNFAVFFACSCWVGATIPVSLPMSIGPLAIGMGILVRKRSILLLAGLLAASVMSFHARNGLQPLAPRQWGGTVTLVSDPNFFPGRVLVDVDSSLGRLQLSVSGRQAASVGSVVAGQQLSVKGTLRPLTHPDRLVSRHLRMSLIATEVSRSPVNDVWRAPLNFVRNVILRGADALPEQQRPIYAGFVIGADQGSDEAVVGEFEASGLSHLLVVSGENVVFVLAVATPLLARLGRRTRTAALLGVLVLFAGVTRFEPSVLRATAMAMIAVAGANAGRPIAARTRLCTAVALLVLLDPLLVESLGFRLSVAATIGITLFARAISQRLVGPQWFRQVLAITIAAQIAVAPLVIPAFGPMPLASLPANVLAEPVAGFVMMWGSSVGLLAGLVGGWPAVVLQTPVRLGVWWIMWVAAHCATLPLPRVSLPVLGLCCGTVVVWWRLRVAWNRRRSTRFDRLSAG